MKAAVYYETGGPEVFRYEDVPKPACPPDGVVIDVRAVSIEGGLARLPAGLTVGLPKLDPGSARSVDGSLVESRHRLPPQSDGATDGVAAEAIRRTSAAFRSVWRAEHVINDEVRKVNDTVGVE